MKILFIANVDESKILPSYIQEFIDKGFEVKICRISGMFPRQNLIVRLKRRFGLNIRSNVRTRKKHLEGKIMSAVKEFIPDIVIELNGMMLNAHCADQIRKRAFLVAKMIDRISFFPEYYEEDFSKHYDTIYTYALEDYELINSISNNCVFIPAMCEEDVYHNDYLKRDIDVSFVGKMYPEKDYGDRYEIFRKLVIECPELEIFIGGECAPYRRPKKYMEWIGNPAYKKAFNNKQISRVKCNEIYNRSKISISMERNGTGNSWSGRLVNLFGTGTFVLASDDSEMLNQYFAGCFVHFTDYEDLKKKIFYYLNHDEERNMIAEKAYKRIQELKTDPININMTDNIIERLRQRHR
jgi:spore maturation protein CgeB